MKMISTQGQDGNLWGGRFHFPLAECIASSGLLVVAASIAVAVIASDPRALVPGLTFAATLGMAYMFYRYVRSARFDTSEMAAAAGTERAFRMDMHPLFESGWEDDLAEDSPEWVDMTDATFFRVVGTRGICPRGLTGGDFLRAGADGSIAPAL